MGRFQCPEYPSTLCREISLVPDPKWRDRGDASHSSEHFQTLVMHNLMPCSNWFRFAYMHLVRPH